MTAKHTLHMALRSDETIRVGTTCLQLVIHNSSPVMNYKQVVIRLYAPLGVTLKPSKVEIAPLPANSSHITAVTLTTTRPGSHSIKMQANTFPKPEEEEFPYTTQQVDVLPELKNTPNSAKNSILEEITYFETTHSNSSLSPTRSDDKNNVYSRYLTGLNHLKGRLERSHPQYSDFLAYEQQLKENIRATIRFGDTENRRAGRTEVVERLNELALSILDTTFNELCE